MNTDCNKCGAREAVEEFDRTPKRIVTRCTDCGFTTVVYRQAATNRLVQEREVVEL